MSTPRDSDVCIGRQVACDSVSSSGLEKQPLDEPVVHVQSEDEPDALPTRMEYTVKDALVVLLSIVSFLVDTGTDIWVAVYFYRQERVWEFVLTLTFVVVPALTMTGFSLRWYLNDADNLDMGDGVTRVKKPHVPMWKWVLRIFCLVFQLSPLLRYGESMFYGIRSMRAQRLNDREEHVKNYIYMIYKDADATLLRLFESFMEAAPQLVLQVYILVSDHHHQDQPHSTLSSSLQGIAIASSLFSLAWSLCSYQRSLRYSLPAKRNLNLSATVTLFLWHLCSIAARVLAISLCASVYPMYVAAGCLAHWSLMTLWLIWQQTEACYTRCEELLFDMVLGAVYIFTFFNVKDQPTRYKYALFYTVCGVENCALIAAWFVKADSRLWWHQPGIVAQLLLFSMSVLLMLAYYRFFHPSLSSPAGTTAAENWTPAPLCAPAQMCRNPHLTRQYGLSLEEWTESQPQHQEGRTANGKSAANC